MLENHKNIKQVYFSKWLSISTQTIILYWEIVKKY